MRISGPIAVHIVSYRGIQYHLYCDRHNSREGECSRCEDPSTCKSLSLFMHEALSNCNRDGVEANFYLESPFVLVDDSPRVTHSTKGLDMIDSLQIEFQKSLMRDKEQSPYMPCGKVHYTDIRDVYVDSYGSDGLRRSSSANPLSGSWMRRRMDGAAYSGCKESVLEAVEDVTTHMRFILDNSERVFMSFVCTSFNPPLCGRGDDAALDYNRRVERMRLMTSDGIHRVCKQLEKLDGSNGILEWVTERFHRERKAAERLFSEWKKRVGWFVASGDISMYNDIRYLPVMIPIAMGSLSMDAYFLARSMYHGGDVYMFGGSAHVDNYLDFFESNGGVIIYSARGEEGSERCVVLRR